jgi:hypothetical protein
MLNITKTGFPEPPDRIVANNCIVATNDTMLTYANTITYLVQYNLLLTEANQKEALEHLASRK